MAMIRVEVVHALPDEQRIIEVEVVAGSTVRDAIAASRLLVMRPHIDLAHCALGRFGAVVALEAPLADGDRIEVYRPLAVDPKAARRLRARRQRR